jgi:hypothetical protein
MMVRPKQPQVPSTKKRASNADSALAEALRIRDEHQRSIVEAGWTGEHIDKLHSEAIASPEGQHLIDEIRAEREQRRTMKLRALPRGPKRTGGAKA